MTAVRVKNDFSLQMLTYDGHWHAGVVCSSRLNPGFNCTGQMADRQRVWRSVGERFADANVVNRVSYGGGGVMVWAGISYGQTLLYFIDDHLNAQRDWCLT